MLAPPGTEATYTEGLWRLPRTWMAYAGDPALPLDWAPEPGALRLGCFNSFARVTGTTLELWAALLHALPHATLQLKSSQLDPAQANAQAIREHMAGAGIDPARLRFLPAEADWRAHMARYNQVDLALDTLPVSSGSTAFEALWMGVPLVTLAGDWIGARMSASVLTGPGHPEWVTRHAQDTVRVVRDLAQDEPLRRQLRATQRARMQASPLCDPADLARHLMAAWEAMYDGSAPA